MDRPGVLKLKITGTILKVRNRKKHAQNIQDFDITTTSAADFRKKIFESVVHHIEGRLTFIATDDQTPAKPTIEPVANKTIEEFEKYIEVPNNKNIKTLSEVSDTYYNKLVQNQELEIKVLKYGPRATEAHVATLEAQHPHKIEQGQ